MYTHISAAISIARRATSSAESSGISINARAAAFYELKKLRIANCKGDDAYEKAYEKVRLTWKGGEFNMRELVDIRQVNTETETIGER